MSLPEGPSRATVFAIVGTALSLATFLVFMVIGPDLFEPPKARADSYSRSAVGHAPLVDLLRALEVPVVVSRYRTVDRVGPDDLVLVLEPSDSAVAPDLFGNPDDTGSAHVLDLLSEGSALLVLPKRLPMEDPVVRGWIRGAPPRGGQGSKGLLEQLGLDPTLDVGSAPGRWTENELGATPTFPADVQTLRPSPNLTAVVASGTRILLGRVRAEPELPDLWVLSDPDLLASFGLHLGENALFVARLIDKARPPSGVVVLDETVHGYGRRPSLWASLLRWPLVLPVVAALLAALVWVAAGSVRFGSPPRLGSALAPGTRFLIENSADLLRLGGHTAHALRRYHETNVQAVARATHAPANLSAAELREWIASAGAGRKVETRLEDLEAAVAAATSSGDRREVLAAAQLIHGWREEMTHGPRGDS